MNKGLGGEYFSNLPGFAASLYDSMMRIKAIRLQYQEMAQDLVSRIDRGALLDIGTGPGFLLLEIHKLNPRIELNRLDLSKAMVNLARNNLAILKIDLRMGTICGTT
jgi:ubiquinone/menaquinone biosynthesis C-methylase UbiE